MKTIDISTMNYATTYTVTIGEGLIAGIARLNDFEQYSSIVIISDSVVAPLYIEKLQDAILQVVENIKIHQFICKAGEKNKNLQTVYEGYESLIKAKADRRTLVINLGGGVVSDMGGYIASTYLRGISYITIPTTLESMVDASVGGKTGVNVGGLKNYVGVFANPQAVIIDTEMLKTLSDRILTQGFAEVIKHGLIKDAVYFEKIRQMIPTQLSRDELIDMIHGSIQIKSDIVQQDPHEKGIRKLLNFGHTIGHVIETLSLRTEDPLYHGEAVAIGMVAEAYISNKEGMLSDEEFEIVEKTIKDAGLPVRFKSDISVDQIADMLVSDKKTEKGSIKWSLLERIGQGEFNIVVTDSFIRKAISYVLKT